jgi:hypothetical protein
MEKSAASRAWNGIDTAAPAKPKGLDWSKKMSNHVAYALLVYTTLQIFVTMGELHSKAGSALPYFALILLVAAIIPACRSFERRWAGLDDQARSDPGQKSRFIRDCLLLWVLAIGLPFFVTGLFRALSMLFGTVHS